MYSFNIASAVPLTGTISYVSLAEKVNVPMLNLRRLIRHAITNHIFQEPTKGLVAHTSRSRLLLEDPHLNAWVGFTSEDLWLPIASTVKAMKQWPGSQESNETGVNLAYGTDVPWFDFLQQDKELANRYNMAMQAHGGGEGFSVDHTVSGYPWNELPEGSTVVDVSAVQLFSPSKCKIDVLTKDPSRWAATKATSPSHSPPPFPLYTSSCKTQPGCALPLPSAPFPLNSNPASPLPLMISSPRKLW